MIVNFKQIYQWIYYLNIDYQLKRYLNLFEREPSIYLKQYHGSIVQLILLSWFSFNCITLTLHPTFPTPFRILMFDFSLIYKLSQVENWTVLLFCFDTIYFLYNMYHSRTFLVIKVTRTILNQTRINQANHFDLKLEKYVKWQNRKYDSIKFVAQTVEKYTKSVRNFVLLQLAALALHIGTLMPLFIDNIEIYFVNSYLEGILCTIWFMINLSVQALFIHMFTISAILSSIMFVSFTIYVFIRFQQVELLISQKVRNKLSFNLKLSTFMSRHTDITKHVLNFNKYYGILLFAFIVAMLPINSYIMIGITFGYFTQMTAIFFSAFSTFQYMAIVGFHILAALYTNRIHQCVKRLIQIEIGRCCLHWKRYLRVSSKLPIEMHLKVSHYIEKFNVTKRYGITYGSFGLMSFTSFTKFILLYGELNMYWYQLMGNRKSSPQTY
ncbi:hypothetical protein BLOT_015894 [Blomia tropicalis]|nr:hypothetical protein BLOT_015894 [Blomia tropicalis]